MGYNPTKQHKQSMPTDTNQKELAGWVKPVCGIVVTCLAGLTAGPAVHVSHYKPTVAIERLQHAREADHTEPGMFQPAPRLSYAYGQSTASGTYHDGFSDWGTSSGWGGRA